jgi:hypothetical protein
MTKVAWIVAGMLLSLAATAGFQHRLQAEDQPKKEKTKVVLPAEKELFAKESWYKDRPEKEQEFAGVLKRVQRKGDFGFARFNPFRLEMKDSAREVHVGDHKEVLLPYVGQRLKLIGKAVDMEVEGNQHHEIWPARLIVLDPGTMKDVTDTPQTEEESE